MADLLQHINQMKTAEGYGFKQEYEVGLWRKLSGQLWLDPYPDSPQGNLRL